MQFGNLVIFYQYSCNSNMTIVGKAIETCIYWFNV